MKLGFAAKKNKKNKKKKQTQKSVDGGDEAHMRDAEDVPTVDSSVPASAKDKQKQKMQQKKALQLRVDSLKKSRSKVTKLPVGNTVRREYARLINDSLEELAAGTAVVPAAAAATAATTSEVLPAVAQEGHDVMQE